MINRLSILTVSAFISLFSLKGYAENAHPEVMKVGVFITNIHDINFAKKEFSATFWIWFLHSGKYKRPENIFEIVNSKKMSILHRSEHKIPTGQTLNLAKISATMIENWKLKEFPFDSHELKIKIEALGHSSKEIIYEVDCKNSILLKETVQDSLEGWHILKYDLHSNIETYPSSFGNPVSAAYDSFSMITPTLYIKRDWPAEFTRLFLTLYFSFIFALFSILLPNYKLSPKITLVSISIAAIIVSKFVVDSYLTSTGGLSLYSTIEMITLWSIFIMMLYDIIVYLSNKNLILRTRKYRLFVFFGMLIIYVSFNAFWVIQSIQNHKYAFTNLTTVCKNNLWGNINRKSNHQ